MPIVAGLAAPELIFLGLLFVLLLYTTRSVWVPLVIAMLQAIPVAGDWLASHAAVAIRAAEAWVAARVEGAIGAVVQAVQTVESRLRWTLVALLVHAQLTVQALAHIVYELLPAVTRALQATIETVAGAILAQVHQELDQLARDAQAADATAGALAESAAGLARSLVTQLQSDVQQALNRLEGGLRAFVLAVAALVLGRAEQAIAQEAAQARAAEAALAGAAAAGVADAEAVARALTGAAEGYAAGLAHDVEQLARLLNQQTLAQALAASGAVAVGLEAIRELECIKQCSPLGNLGKDLAALDLAALLALVAYAAHDPRGAGRLVQSTLGPVVTEGANLARGVLGR